MRVQEKDLHARDLTYHFEEVSLYGFRDIHVVLCPAGWMRRVESAQVEIIRGGDEVGSVTSNNNTRASQHIPCPADIAELISDTQNSECTDADRYSSHSEKPCVILVNIYEQIQQQYCVASFLLLLNNFFSFQSPQSSVSSYLNGTRSGNSDLGLGSYRKVRPEDL